MRFKTLAGLFLQQNSNVKREIRLRGLKICERKIATVKIKMSAAGFEPARISPCELESHALDHSATLTNDYASGAIRSMARFYS